jgi:hypothetical protein
MPLSASGDAVTRRPGLLRAAVGAAAVGVLAALLRDMVKAVTRP